MKKIGVYILILVLLSAIVNAGVISLQTTTSNTLSIDTPKGESTVSIVNNGDESAHNLQISLMHLNGKIQTSPKKVSLDKNSKVEEKFDLDLSYLSVPGTYPIIVFIDYTDANNYPFSATSPSYFSYKEETTAKIFATLKPMKVIKRAKGVLSFKNLGDEAKNLKIKLVVPRELVIEPSEVDMEVPKKTEEKLEFEISSLSALPGSSYTLFAVISYEEGGKFYSSIVNGLVKVAQGTSIFSYFILIIIVLIILILLVVLLQIKKRGKRLHRK